MGTNQCLERYLKLFPIPVGRVKDRASVAAT